VLNKVVGEVLPVRVFELKTPVEKFLCQAVIEPETAEARPYSLNKGISSSAAVAQERGKNPKPPVYVYDSTIFSRLTRFSLVKDIFALERATQCIEMIYYVYESVRRSPTSASVIINIFVVWDFAALLGNGRRSWKFYLIIRAAIRVRLLLTALAENFSNWSF